MMSPITNSSVGYMPDAYTNSSERKSTKSTQVETVPTQEKTKVESIKEQISNGTYKLESSSALAKKMYENMF